MLIPRGDREYYAPQFRFRLPNSSIVLGEIHTLNMFSADRAHITGVSINSNYRNRGHGQRMMKDLISEARKRGVKYLTLDVSKSNKIAQRLYKKVGFVFAPRFRSREQIYGSLMMVKFITPSKLLKRKP